MARTGTAVSTRRSGVSMTAVSPSADASPTGPVPYPCARARHLDTVPVFRVQRVPEPDPVQRVAYLARPDQPGHPLASGYDTIQARVLLKAGN
jgi:hypothetical protein